jgi:hypothetical protein
MSRILEEIGDWLKIRIINQENGIIFDDTDLSSFDQIQNFIEANDHRFKTPVIYYNALAEESAAELLGTLHEELISKLSIHQLQSDLSLPEAIAMAGLKMIIFDQSYLYPQETIEELLTFLAEQQVKIILVGAEAKMNEEFLAVHPAITTWQRLVVNSFNNLEITHNNIVVVEQCNHLSSTC